ncbi:MAG TPA: hypothetical protein VHE30_06225 [Polyangiaceae bacterium]|nr:hypothetical protein [Polyangiaceae bacterium]
MARRSRPPGFDMTYRPQESVFGPPLLAKVPSFLYLGAAVGIWLVVLAGEQSASGTWLFHYVVEEDVARVMSIRTFATIIAVSSLSSVVRAGMRGVRIYPDGVEARDVLSFIWPKLRRYRWPQIEQIILDGSLIAFDLWDGTRAYLPEVSDRGALAHALEHVALARAIPVRGGTLGEEEFDDEDAPEAAD